MSLVTRQCARHLSTTSCLLAKNKGASFMSEEAMALREARKKKKEDAASRKIPIKLTMWPKEARELWYKERLAELAEENRNRPKYTYSKEFVDSYLPSVPGMQSGKRRKSDRAAAAMKKADLEMERASRREFLEIPLPTVHGLYLADADGQTDLAYTAIHYNIHRDVFRREGLLFTVPLNIRYPSKSFVHCGNVIVPSEAQEPPTVSFPPARPDALYTLVMTTPDGNIYHPRSEVLHWLTCNIKGSDLASGDTICPYMPPIPCEGTGYHRYVFTLLLQESRLDGLDVLPPRDLERRTWSTANFIGHHKLSIRSLAFCQAQWDESVGDIFSELGCVEPVYKFEKPLTVRLDPDQREAVRKKEAYFGRNPLERLDRWLQRARALK